MCPWAPKAFTGAPAALLVHSLCSSLGSLCQLPHWPDTPVVARSPGTLPGHTPAPGGGDQPLTVVCGCHAMVAFSHMFPGLALLAPAASLASGASPNSNTPCRLLHGSQVHSHWDVSRYTSPVSLLSPVPVWLYSGASTSALLHDVTSVLCGLSSILLAWPSHTSSLNSGAVVALRVPSKLTDHYSVGSSKCALLGSPSDLGNLVCVWCCLHCECFEVHCIQMMVLMQANSLLLISYSVFTVC